MQKLITKSIQMDDDMIDGIQKEMIKHKVFSFQEMTRRLIKESLETKQAKKEVVANV